jgi:CBS domain containing-hemolysin-like protein
MSIHDFNERFKVELPQSDEYDTIGGFLHKQTGRIPELNEEVRYENVIFTVVKKSQRRIRLVRVHKNPTSASHDVAELASEKHE